MLHFGDGVLGTSIALDPPTLLGTARQLADIVAAHEARFGTLWSEGGERLGAMTDARLQWHERPFASPLAHRLYGLVRNLPLNGVERSFKLMAGELRQDRFLVGLSTSGLAAEDVDYLASRLDAPEAFRAAVRGQLTPQDRASHASFIHLGFEEAADRSQSIYKLYLEFPTPSHDPSRPAMPLYLGYKWNPQDNRQRAVSTYRQPSSLSLAEVHERMAVAYGDARSELFLVAKALVAEAARRTSAAALTFVDVTDDDAQRLSFDVNLYESGLTLHGVEQMLRSLAVRLGIPTGDVSALLDKAGDDLAGHVSGGTDRHGRAFLTLYHACAQGRATSPRGLDLAPTGSR